MLLLDFRVTTLECAFFVLLPCDELLLRLKNFDDSSIIFLHDPFFQKNMNGAKSILRSLSTHLLKKAALKDIVHCLVCLTHCSLCLVRHAKIIAVPDSSNSRIRMLFCKVILQNAKD